MGQTLVGGVGYRWYGDRSFGLVACDALAGEAWPEGVRVEDLGYGALFVAQDLAGAEPAWERLILLGAAQRGREPGLVYRYVHSATRADPDEVQARIREAGAGVIDLDHLLVIAAAFDALPPEVVVYEAEPLDAGGGEALSDELAARLEHVLSAVRAEVLGDAEAAVVAGAGAVVLASAATPGGASAAER